MAMMAMTMNYFPTIEWNSFAATVDGVDCIDIEVGIRYCRFAIDK